MTSTLESERSIETPISVVSCPLEYETVVYGITVLLVIEIDYRIFLFIWTVSKLPLILMMESSLLWHTDLFSSILHIMDPLQNFKFHFMFIFQCLYSSLQSITQIPPVIIGLTEILSLFDLLQFEIHLDRTVFAVNDIVTGWIRIISVKRSLLGMTLRLRMTESTTLESKISSHFLTRSRWSERTYSTVHTPRSY